MRGPRPPTSFLEQYLFYLAKFHICCQNLSSWATRCHPRALERVAAATFESTQSQLKEDMAAIELFLEGVDEWANRQAALDH